MKSSSKKKNAKIGRLSVSLVASFLPGETEEQGRRNLSYTKEYVNIGITVGVRSLPSANSWYPGNFKGGAETHMALRLSLLGSRWIFITVCTAQQAK